MLQSISHFNKLIKEGVLTKKQHIRNEVDQCCYYSINPIEDFSEYAKGFFNKGMFKKPNNILVPNKSTRDRSIINSF